MAAEVAAENGRRQENVAGCEHRCVGYLGSGERPRCHDLARAVKRASERAAVKGSEQVKEGQ